MRTRLESSAAWQLVRHGLPVAAVLVLLVLPAGAALRTVLTVGVVVAAALAVVVEHRLQQRLLDVDGLAVVSAELVGCTDPRSAAQALLSWSVATVGCERGVVVAGPDGQLPLLAAYGVDHLLAHRPGRPGPSSLVAWATGSRQTQVVPGPDEEREAWLCRLLPAARRVVVVPLRSGDRSHGALVLAVDADLPVPPRVVALLERAAEQTAATLRAGWQLDQVQRLAATDGLTKIANRRTFEATLEREIARATRNAEHLSLVMLDIDHFKSLNDAHGHQAGDEVLRNVALALSCECRDFDTAARYGGEEFAVVLPGCGPDEAFEIAERLRLAVSAAPSAVVVTASAGVATFPGHAPDGESLVRAADSALYRSKHDGRDRTSRSDGIPPEAQVDAVLRRAVAQRVAREKEHEAAAQAREATRHDARVTPRESAWEAAREARRAAARREG